MKKWKKNQISTLSHEWLQIKKLQIKYSTYCKYESMINKYIDPFLKEKNIEKLSEIDFVNFLDDLINNKHLSSSTVKSIKDVLNSIYRYGEAKYHLQHIDFKLIKFTKKRQKEKISLPTEEQNKLYEYCVYHRDNLSVAMMLGLFCGLRIGEICGLTWEDIDFKNEIIHINKTVLRLKNNDANSQSKTKLFISEPKTETSTRDVITPPFVMEYLRSYYEGYDIDETTKHYFILSYKEKPLDPRSVQKRFKGLCKQCDIECTFHTLRHTFATNCIEQKIDIKTVSEILGHASVDITLNRYVHPSLDYKKEQISKIKEPKIYMPFDI
jgi:integrase